MPGKSSFFRLAGAGLIHAGVFIALAGCLLTAMLRTQWTERLFDGQSMELDTGYSISIRDTRFTLSSNGTVESWITTVTFITPGDDTQEGQAGINSPWDCAGLRICLTDWEPVMGVVLADSEGNHYVIHPDEGFREKGTYFGFSSSRVNQDGLAASALFDEFDGTGRRVNVINANPGDMIGSLLLAGFVWRGESTITVSRDPGFPVIILGMVLIVSGSVLALALYLLKEQQP